MGRFGLILPPLLESDGRNKGAMKAQRGGLPMKNREWNMLAHGPYGKAYHGRMALFKKEGNRPRMGPKKEREGKKGSTGLPSRN